MKLLVTVISCGTMIGRRLLCRESWMKHLPDNVEAFFVSGTPGIDGEDDVYVVQAGDTWRDLPAKVLASMRLALTISDWEWWAKVDDDTLFIAEKALDLLTNIPSNEGIVVKQYPREMKHSIGFCYFIRHNVVQQIVDRHDNGKYILPNIGFENIEIHNAARAAGWKLYGTDQICFPNEYQIGDSTVAILCDRLDTMVDMAYTIFNKK